MPRLGVLQHELDEAEDREEGVVDLVRDAGRELADRRELAALDDLLLEAAALAQVADQADGRDRSLRRPRGRRAG